MRIDNGQKQIPIGEPFGNSIERWANRIPSSVTLGTLLFDKQLLSPHCISGFPGNGL